MVLLGCSYLRPEATKGELFGLGGSHPWTTEVASHALSIIGKVILGRSVLSSMHVYLLSNTWMPKVCLLKLDQLFQYFL